MTTASINIDVNSGELDKLIGQLEEADRELDGVKRSADQAARSMNNLGDEAVKAGNKVEALLP